MAGKRPDAEIWGMTDLAWLAAAAYERYRTWSPRKNLKAGLSEWQDLRDQEKAAWCGAAYEIIQGLTEAEVRRVAAAVEPWLLQLEAGEEESADAKAE